MQNEYEYYQREIDKYFEDINDFFNLPEQIQDKLIINPVFKYEEIWERLNSEHRIEITLFRPDFKYEKYWDELGEVERNNVIMYNRNFDYKKYIPNPTHKDFELLVGRNDFDSEKYFKQLNKINKLRVCSKNKFKYENYWDELNDSMKIEIIKHNDYFNPEPYIDELLIQYVDEKSLLDIFCERNNSIYYDNIWDKLSVLQKMKISSKNKDFIVGDKKEELLLIFKKYPFQIIDFIDYKIISKPDFFNNGDVEINIGELSTNIKDIAIDIFKSFSLLEENEINRKEIITGNNKTIELSDNLQKVFPACIVKKQKEYYFYNIPYNKYVKIIDYVYILRESKLERILNNK